MSDDHGLADPPSDGSYQARSADPGGAAPDSKSTLKPSRRRRRLAAFRGRRPLLGVVAGLLAVAGGRQWAAAGNLPPASWADDRGIAVRWSAQGEPQYYLCQDPTGAVIRQPPVVQTADGLAYFDNWDNSLVWQTPTRRAVIPLANHIPFPWTLRRLSAHPAGVYLCFSREHPTGYPVLDVDLRTQAVRRLPSVLAARGSPWASASVFRRSDGFWLTGAHGEQRLEGVHADAGDWDFDFQGGALYYARGGSVWVLAPGKEARWLWTSVAPPIQVFVVPGGGGAWVVETLFPGATNVIGVSPQGRRSKVIARTSISAIPIGVPTDLLAATVAQMLRDGQPVGEQYPSSSDGNRQRSSP